MAQSGFACSAMLMLRHWRVGLILLGVGLLASPSWADKEQTDRAIATYLNTTLPAIAKMKPFIDKPAVARAKAFPAMSGDDDPCGSAVDSIYAHQRLAEGAIGVCRAMFRWMQNDEIGTCATTRYARMDLFNTTYAHDPVILKRHKADGVEKIRQRTEEAAGCDRKDLVYWGKQTVALDDQLARSLSPTSELITRSPEVAPPTQDEFNVWDFNCHAARNLVGADKSNVVEAADDGCYATYWLSRKDKTSACVSLAKGLDRLGKGSGGDPLANEAPALKARLSARFDTLTCARQIAALKLAEAALANAEAAKVAAEKARQAAAAAAEAPSPSATTLAFVAKANDLVRKINQETQWFNRLQSEAEALDKRGDTGAACEKFQFALSSLRTVAGYYFELGDHTGEQSHFDEKDRLRAQAIQMRDGDHPGGTCREYGRSLE